MSSSCVWRRLGGGCVEDSRSRQSGRRLPLSLSKVLNSGWVMTSHALDKPPTIDIYRTLDTSRQCWAPGGWRPGRDTNNYTKEELCTLEYLNMIKNFDVYWCAREYDQFNSGSPNSWATKRWCFIGRTLACHALGPCLRRWNSIWAALECTCCWISGWLQAKL